MRGLMAAVIGMGILIVAGLTVIVVVMVQRVSSVSAPSARSALSVVLDEPQGTRITGTSLDGERITVQLDGGGRPDRVVILDARSGRMLGRVALAR